jgi:sarcosine oxidase
LFGAAATRYLSQSGQRVLLIGPDEPADWQTHQGVFASHYDQGRITRQLSDDPIWSQLAAEAIAGYPALESAAGIAFHVPAGVLFVAPQGSGRDYLAPVRQIAHVRGVAYEALPDQAALASRFPFLRFPASCHGLYEPAPAGYINPRDVIRAQLAVAQQHGATIIPELVTGITQTAGHAALTTQSGNRYTASRALVAAGAFSNCHQLLPRPLALRVKSETIILARLPDAEARRLAAMPCLIYEIQSPLLEGIYLLPPVRYPDGRYYLKMGCDTAADQWLPDLEAMRRWMISGESDVMLSPMRQALDAIIPGLAAEAFQTKRCMASRLLIAWAKGYLWQRGAMARRRNVRTPSAVWRRR